MPTPLRPQEIYLLERFSSKEYYQQMQDAWAAMLKHVEDCLQRFMRQLPADYRKRGLPMQPDIVWGDTVLPNFRRTMDALNKCFINLVHGDYSSLLAAHRVSNDMRGQREYWSGWLDEVEPGADDQYWGLIGRASHFASNILATAEAYWVTTFLTIGYSEERGPLDPPPAWPRYRLNPQVQVRTGEPVPQTGVYLPDVDDACAQFLIASHHFTSYTRNAPEASVGYDPDTLQNISEAPTLWTVVERVPGETVPFEEGLGPLPVPPVYAGQPCPRAGFWFTLAQHDSRRHFQQGEIFPEVPRGLAKGHVLWLWDEGQDGTPAVLSSSAATVDLSTPVADTPSAFANSGEPAPRAGLWQVIDNPSVQFRAGQAGEALPTYQGQPLRWQWIEQPGTGLRATSGQPCPYPGVWSCEDWPTGPHTFLHGVPLPKVQGRDVTWFLVRTQ
ncbi:hypothetical protein [Azoarcus indigens]|uniref:Uncharacterized protein n=1 Tax=Azoarcus indigens TaxID=29545 RepID=A0A4R6DWG6_9RHOO|nr:hypothetical protein [Azoarcus indigens]TDN49620.1 hypothetical protein C7389_11199 [Azoarcus indigens]